MNYTEEEVKRLAEASRAYLDAVNGHAEQDDPEALRPFFDELEAALEPFEK